MNANYIYVALCFIPLVLYLIKLRNFKLNVKKMVVIAMFSGLSFILSKIVFIQYPQGGSINLLSSLPILLIGLIYGPVEGMTTGLITGVLGLFGGFKSKSILWVLNRCIFKMLCTRSIRSCVLCIICRTI